jgi:hypothetical protein
LFVVKFQLRVEHFADSHLSFDCSGDVVDILRLNEGLEIILQDLRKVILKFRSTEILQDLLPIRRVLPA